MHTIETALCTGVTLILVTVLVAAGPVAYGRLRDTAAAAAWASYARLDREELYAVDGIQIETCSISAVSTSPERLRSLIGTASGILSPFFGWIRELLDGTALPRAGA